MKTIFMILALMVSGVANADSLLLGSLTVHGLHNEQIVASRMPRRWDSDGEVVLTPGIGYSLNRGDSVLLGSVLKDCYDHWASTLLVGKDLWTFKSFQVGAYAGLYVREKPTYIGNDGVEYTAKDFPWPIDMGHMQVIPAFFMKVDILPKEKVHPVIMTNYFITNISIEILF